MDAHVLKPHHRRYTRRTSIESRPTDRGRHRRKRSKLLLRRVSPEPEPPRRTTSIPELKLGRDHHRDSPEIASRASRSIFFSPRLRRASPRLNGISSRSEATRNTKSLIGLSDKRTAGENKTITRHQNLKPTVYPL
ncbi:hypothetical protein Rs2_34630 [Raphanus sativus]|nr:hypothetical protein Rs2_47924 [Raphanus sativus]KAJ4884537.1 hypothetical protein Rs2_34630 [Raphanus sativus]